MSYTWNEFYRDMNMVQINTVTHVGDFVFRMFAGAYKTVKVLNMWVPVRFSYLIIITAFLRLMCSWYGKFT